MSTPFFGPGWARGQACLELQPRGVAPQLFEHAEDILEVLRVHARIPLLVGCSSTGLVANGEEIQEDAGLSLALYHLPGASLRAVHFGQEALLESGDASEWVERTGVRRADVNGWLVFADPFNMDGERWLRQWNEAYPGVPCVGGLAGGIAAEQRTQVYLNGAVHEEGLVALAVGGAVRIESVVSQGCTPIGESWIITRTDRQFILQIANRPAYSVLVETFNALSKEDQAKAQRNLFVGLASSEYREEFHPNVLVRNWQGIPLENKREDWIGEGEVPLEFSLLMNKTGIDNRSAYRPVWNRLAESVGRASASPRPGDLAP